MISVPSKLVGRNIIASAQNSILVQDVFPHPLSYGENSNQCCGDGEYDGRIHDFWGLIEADHAQNNGDQSQYC
jgi:hypothetical protein